MNTNFAQRAKDIVAKNGKNKKSIIAQLDALRREQFMHEQQLKGQAGQDPNNPQPSNSGLPTGSQNLQDGMATNGQTMAQGGTISPQMMQPMQSMQQGQQSPQSPQMVQQMSSPRQAPQQPMQASKPTLNKELAVGKKVELEHATTLDYIKKYMDQHGKLPTKGKLAKSIAVDHIKDFKEDNPGSKSSYYKGLVNNGLSDEVKKYLLGGNLSPNEASDAQIENIRQMELGGRIDNNYPQSLYDSLSYIDSARSNHINNHALGGNIRSAYALPNVEINSYALGNQIDSVGVGPDNEYKDGGGIHIKKSHEGRFTEYKKRTGKTTEEALHSKDPHVRQMANFARNASHWKHALGGGLNNDRMNDPNQTPEQYAIGGGLNQDPRNMAPIQWTDPSFRTRYDLGGDIKFAQPDGQLRQYAVGGPIIPNTIFNQGRTEYLPQIKNVNSNPYLNNGYANGGNMYDGGGGVENLPITGVNTLPDNPAPLQRNNYDQWGNHASGQSSQQKWLPLIQKYFPQSEWSNAYKTMINESSGIAANININKDNSQDTGLFQINNKYHPEAYQSGNMYDPEDNVKLASQIWANAEKTKGAGHGWDEWSSTNKISRTGAPVTPVDREYSQGINPITQKLNIQQVSPLTANYLKPEIAGLQSSSQVGSNNPHNADKEESDGADWNQMMRYAPIAANAIAGITARKIPPLSTNVNMPTMNANLISPERLSEEPIRQQIGSQYNNAVNALSGASGGSGAAMRAGLTGLALNSGKSASEALNDIQNRNAMLRGEATKYNAQAQQEANRVNLGQRTRGIELGRENQLLNQQDVAARDMVRRQSLMGAATGLGQIGKENVQSQMLGEIYGYDSKGEKILHTDGPARKAAFDPKITAMILKQAYNPKS